MKNTVIKAASLTAALQFAACGGAVNTEAKSPVTEARKNVMRQDARGLVIRCETDGPGSAMTKDVKSDTAKVTVGQGRLAVELAGGAPLPEGPVTGCRFMPYVQTYNASDDTTLFETGTNSVEIRCTFEGASKAVPTRGATDMFMLPGGSGLAGMSFEEPGNDAKVEHAVLPPGSVCELKLVR